jgi:hypothetical protein
MVTAEIQTQAGEAARARKTCVLMLDPPDFRPPCPDWRLNGNPPIVGRLPLDFPKIPTTLIQRLHAG